MLKNQKIVTRNRLCTVLLCLVVVLLLSYLQRNKSDYSYAITILQRCSIYALAAVSMNLLTGFTGLFSLGQAGFMAIGAYTVGMFTVPREVRETVYYMSGINETIASIELPVLAAIVLGGVLAAVMAFFVGFCVLRLKSDYLAIATLGFSEIVRAVIASPQLERITNGSYGLKKIPSFAAVFPDFPEFSAIFAPFIIAVACIAVMVLLINSSYGRAFKAIREDSVAAEAMGINLFKHKQFSFIISSFFTGIGGGLLALFMRSIDSKTFSISITYDILLIVVLGGIGSVTGSVLGAFILTASREWLRFFDQPLIIGGWQVPLFRAGFRMVIFSVLLMVIVLFYRKGLMGTREFSWDGLFAFFAKWRDKLFRRKGAAKA